MGSSPEEISKYLGNTEPLSGAEIRELSIALSKLAADGTLIPKHLLRHGDSGESGIGPYYGFTLSAIPKSLDRLGTDREEVVVGLIRRFEQVVREHYERAKNRTLDKEISARYLGVAFLLRVVKPKTEAGAIRVADFLQSERDEVIGHAAEMLEGIPYFSSVVDRLFDSIATHGIHEWPNHQARALASFADVPEVRHRVLNCFHSQDESLRKGAVLAFSYLNEKAGPEAESELFAIAANDKDKLQSEALNGLRKITPQSSKLRQLALRLIQSDKYWVRGHAIACLEAFSDRESISALLASLLDEGGYDFDNAGVAAKLLEKMPLDADSVLAPLMATLRAVLEREDKLYDGQGDVRNHEQIFEAAIKAEAIKGGKSAELMPARLYADSETLFSIARVLAKLGATARPAIPLIESCLTRPYVSSARDEQDWRDILNAIENP